MMTNPRTPKPATKTAPAKVEEKPNTKTETPELKPYLVGHPALDPFLEMLFDSVAQYKTLDAQLAAADGDKEKAVAGYIESSSDDEIVKRREMIAKLTAELNAIAETAVASSQLTDDEKTKNKTELDTLKLTIKNGRDAITKTADAFAALVPKENVLKALEEMGDPTRSGRGRKPGQAGSSLPRANVIITVNGGNLTGVKFQNFSSLAAKINPSSDNPAKDLLEAFASAAGVEFENVKSVDKPITFEFTPPGEKASTYTISTVPKPRAKPGPGETKTEEKTKEKSAA